MLRARVQQALGSTTRAVQDCLLVGQSLNETRDDFNRNRNVDGSFSEEDDGFMEFVAKNLPEISHSTAQRWMRAAAKVLEVVSRLQPEGCAPCDVRVSEVLDSSEDELGSEELRAFRRAWMELTANKTIKDCLAGVLVGGEGGERVDRALNGKLLGGAGGDRKDYAEFVLVKLRHFNTFFSSWGSMSEKQRTEIKSEFCAAICGDEFKLRGRVGYEKEGPVRFEPWPEEVCEVAMEAIRARLKARR